MKLEQLITCINKILSEAEQPFLFGMRYKALNLFFYQCQEALEKFAGDPDQHKKSLLAALHRLSFYDSAGKYCAVCLDELKLKQETDKLPDDNEQVLKRITDTMTEAQAKQTIDEAKKRYQANFPDRYHQDPLGYEKLTKNAREFPSAAVTALPDWFGNKVKIFADQQILLLQGPCKKEPSEAYAGLNASVTHQEHVGRFFAAIQKNNINCIVTFGDDFFAYDPGSFDALGRDFKVKVEETVGQRRKKLIIDYVDPDDKKTKHLEVDYMNFPVADNSPLLFGYWQLNELDEELEKLRKLAAHCASGVGRSGAFVAFVAFTKDQDLMADINKLVIETMPSLLAAERPQAAQTQPDIVETIAASLQLMSNSTLQQDLTAIINKAKAIFIELRTKGRFLVQEKSQFYAAVISGFLYAFFKRLQQMPELNLVAKIKMMDTLTQKLAEVILFPEVARECIQKGVEDPSKIQTARQKVLMLAWLQIASTDLSLNYFCDQLTKNFKIALNLGDPEKSKIRAVFKKWRDFIKLTEPLVKREENSKKTQGRDHKLAEVSSGEYMNYADAAVDVAKSLNEFADGTPEQQEFLKSFARVILENLSRMPQIIDALVVRHVTNPDAKKPDAKNPDAKNPDPNNPPAADFNNYCDQFLLATKVSPIIGSPSTPGSILNLQTTRDLFSKDKCRTREDIEKLVENLKNLRKLVYDNYENKPHRKDIYQKYKAAFIQFLLGIDSVIDKITKSPLKVIEQLTLTLPQAMPAAASASTPAPAPGY